MGSQASGMLASAARHGWVPGMGESPAPSHFAVPKAAETRVMLRCGVEMSLDMQLHDAMSHLPGNALHPFFRISQPMST